MKSSLILIFWSPFIHHRLHMWSMQTRWSISTLLYTAKSVVVMKISNAMTTNYVQRIPIGIWFWFSKTPDGRQSNTLKVCSTLFCFVYICLSLPIYFVYTHTHIPYACAYLAYTRWTIDEPPNKIEFGVTKKRKTSAMLKTHTRFNGGAGATLNRMQFSSNFRRVQQAQGTRNERKWTRGGQRKTDENTHTWHEIIAIAVFLNLL